MDCNYNGTDTKTRTNEISIDMIAIWESIFPDIEYNRNGNNSKERDINVNSIVKYHHIVPFFVCKFENVTFDELQRNNEIKVCQTEVECYAWINMHRLKTRIFGTKQDISNRANVEKGKQMEASQETINCKAWNKDNQQISLTWDSFLGIYPNHIGQGMGRGHKYALRKLIEKYDP